MKYAGAAKSIAKTAHEPAFGSTLPHKAHGTLVDATIIDAPSSTKNKSGARAPEMSSTKKGNNWYFDMKAHIGVDADSGVTHSLETSTAKLPPLVEYDAFDCRAADSQVWDELLHGEETSA
jgi:IS5 family transposase